MDDLSNLNAPKSRNLSIDFFRGCTMFFLISGYGRLFDSESSVKIAAFIARQLDHAPWDGLTTWDLIQPFFMFIVGVAMPFSFYKKYQNGYSWNQIFLTVVRRSVLLLFLGWLIGSTEVTSSFTNVLAQLSISYFISFLITFQPIRWQLFISFLLVFVNELLYWLWPVQGFNHPFTPDHNFGAWFDLILIGRLSPDHWVTFNAIPSTAHTIWGVMAGTLLLRKWPIKKKISFLFAAGVGAIVLGSLLGLYIPIIKRLCTSSFVFLSGGWAILCLAVSYVLIDVLNFKKGVFFFSVVGMNPLFIYLFDHSGGKIVLESFSRPITYRLFSWMGDAIVHITDVFLVSGMLWYVCYFLYKSKIFIRI